jgi:hypothetical protein
VWVELYLHLPTAPAWNVTGQAVPVIFILKNLIIYQFTFLFC